MMDLTFKVDKFRSCLLIQQKYKDHDFSINLLNLRGFIQAKINKKWHGYTEVK